MPELGRACLIVARIERLALFAFAQHLKPQCAGGRDCFHQSHLDCVAQTECCTGALPNEGVDRFIVAIEVIRQRRNGHKPICAALLQANKKARTRDTSDAAGKRCANAIGEVRGNQTVNRFTLSGHGAAFRVRDLFGDFSKACGFAVIQSARAKTQGAHQRAVSKKVGIAADG
jgi:hypothetical protein